MAALYVVLHCGQNGMVFSPCERMLLETAPAKGLGFCNAPRHGAFKLRGFSSLRFRYYGNTDEKICQR